MSIPPLQVPRKLDSVPIETVIVHADEIIHGVMFTEEVLERVAEVNTSLHYDKKKKALMWRGLITGVKFDEKKEEEVFLNLLEKASMGCTAPPKKDFDSKNCQTCHPRKDEPPRD